MIWKNRESPLCWSFDAKRSGKKFPSFTFAANLLFCAFDVSILGSFCRRRAQKGGHFEPKNKQFFCWRQHSEKSLRHTGNLHSGWARKANFLTPPPNFRALGAASKSIIISTINNSSGSFSIVPLSKKRDRSSIFGS